MMPKINIAFAWPGLPDYASRCIRAVIDTRSVNVTVLATTASVPIKGVEQSLGQSVTWVKAEDQTVSWSSLNLERPDLLFLGGYATPSFNALAKETRNAGGKTVLMADNHCPRSRKDRLLSALWHRFKHRRRFDGVFVPGRSGRQLARLWGYDDPIIWEGLYGADPALFQNSTPITKRPNAMIFVGQFIDRKNVQGLVEAFGRFADTHNQWTLTLCGSGPLKDHLPRHPAITIHDFVQPKDLAKLMAEHRVLILPSLEEHWGLVVHEAALSGCALVLSDQVGAADDLACPSNAVLCRAGDHKALEDAFVTLSRWDDNAWAVAEDDSRRLAAQFSPAVFASAVAAMTAHFWGTLA